MPVPPNTSPATAIALVVGVPHTTLAADVQLAPNGTGFTSNCKPSNPQINALWYKYTIPAGVKYISFGVVGVDYSATYNPYVHVRKETSPGVYTQFQEKYNANSYCRNMETAATYTSAFLILGDPGTTYYFHIQNDTASVVDANLTVIVTHAPSGQGEADDIIIPDDTAPYPPAVIRSGSGVLVGYTAYDKDWWGEEFSVIQRGGWVCNRQRSSGGTYGVCCFGPPPNFDLLTTTNTLTWGTAFTGFCSDQISKHYVATYGSTQYLHRFDAKTGVKEATIALPTRMSLLIGVHTASGVVYYSDDTDYSTVHRYNINTSTVMTDFLPSYSDQYLGDGFVLPNGDVGVCYQDADDTWRIYHSDGTLVSSNIRNYHRFSLDNNLTGIWFWEISDRHRFSHVMLASLTTNDQSFTTSAPMIGTSGGPIVVYDTNQIFGYSDSCPVLVYPLVLVDISGIYYMNPAKMTNHDSYYNSVEKKIPNPTIRTSLMGE